MQNLSIVSPEIKGIVFDLDDTLYPQVEYKLSGFNVVASWLEEKRGIDSTTVLYGLETILDEFGASYPNMFDRLVERLGIDIGFVEQLVRLFIEHEPRICCYDGVIPMLSRLRKKYLLGILTDGRYVVQQKKISALGLYTRVDQILCSDAMGLEKPDSRLFEWFEKKFELEGCNLMYVGDNIEKDFYGANIRGWISVMVKTGEIKRHTNKSGCEPRIEIPSVAFLEKAIKHISPKPETSEVGEGIWSIL